MQTYPSIQELQQRYCSVCGELIWTKELIDVVCDACSVDRERGNDMQWFEKLKFARKIAALSQREVAAKTDMSDAYLCEIETGKITDPSYFKISRLLSLYNLDHSDIKNDA